MCFFCWTLKIPRTIKIKNQIVLNQSETQRQLTTTNPKETSHNMLDTMKRESPEHAVTNRKICSKRDWGIQRVRVLDSHFTWHGKVSVHEMMHAVGGRKMWRTGSLSDQCIWWIFTSSKKLIHCTEILFVWFTKKDFFSYGEICEQLLWSYANITNP